MEIEHYRRQIQDHGAFNSAYMRYWVEDQITAAGGQRALARQLGINVWEIGNAVTGRRKVSARLARLLGFEREDQRHACYRPVPLEAQPRQS